jgi:hypothetical protein
LFNALFSYQPLEDLYLLLITNKSSNIVEDLETLRLMARVVPEFCADLTDAGVTSQVTFLGSFLPSNFPYTLLSGERADFLEEFGLLP